MGSIYKFIVKVLPKRMIKVLGQTDREMSTCFCWRTANKDAVLVANDAAHDLLFKKRDGIMCKLDIENAYNHINCDFIIIC